MIKGTIFKAITLSLAVVVILSACRKREGLSMPDNYVVFETNEQGIGTGENSITVKVKLSRGTDKDVPVTINLTPLQAVYGTEFTTVPAATNGSITITVPSGNNEGTFVVNKVGGTLYDGDEKIEFDLYSSGSPILIGVNRKFTLSFAELIASNSSLTINGGGATYPNKTFIDLSSNRQTPVLRTNWDLGFYSGDANDFKVILNSSTAMMAKPINKNDLAQVTAADTAGFVPDLTYGTLVPGQMGYVDYPDGDLTKTAIGLISATAADNKVFIVNRGGGVGTPAPARGWKKIRVLRNASGGYTLQHADIASTTFSSIDIPKDDKYFFKYVSFENGIVPVEPEKTKWDIAWTFSGFIFNFGGEVPYVFQDIVFQNKNVQVAKVMTTTKPYADFAEADIAGQTFSSSQMTIGSDWRTTQPAAVRSDRYYIIKDGNNNYYKLKFTAIMDNNSVRGYPAIEYALVKKG